MDARPFLAAHERADSTNIDVRLAEFVVRGGAGDSIGVTLEGDGAKDLRDAAVTLRILVDSARQDLPLQELVSGATVYRFKNEGQVRVRYFIERTVTSIPQGGIRISQHLSQHANVISSYTP